MSGLPCSSVRRISRFGVEPPALLSGHVSRCLACQAEAARSRRVTRVMAHMGSTTIPAPRDLMPRVHTAMGTATTRQRHLKESWPGVAAAATATAVAGAIAVVLAVRRRAQTASLP